MGRLKHLKEKLREDVTFVVVPGAESQLKKIRLPKYILHGALALLLISTVTINSALVYYYINSRKVSLENTQLTNEMADNKDRIARLEELYTSQAKLNEDMKAQAQHVATVYETRLSELENLETQAITLISKLNEDNNVSVHLPVSRSFDRLTDLQSDDTYLYDVQPTENSDELDQLLALIEDDDISILMQQQLNEFTSVIDEVENTLDFLECKPDLKPVDGTITSGFGIRRDPVTGRTNMHKGLDIANTRGTEIKAAGSGIVTFSGYNGSYGKIIVISHGYDYKTVYAHNNKNYVSVGDHVDKGEVIGEVGSTGKSTGPHVHFEVHFEGKQIDPTTVIN